MSVLADTIAVLKLRTSITNLLLTNPKTGVVAIRPDKLAQADAVTATAGAIVIRTSGRGFLNDLNSAGDACTPNLLIDCVAANSILANSIADAVETQLDTYKGTQAGGVIGGYVLDNRVEDWVTLDDGRETGEYCVELTVTCLYTRN